MRRSIRTSRLRRLVTRFPRVFCETSSDCARRAATKGGPSIGRSQVMSDE